MKAEIRDLGKELVWLLSDFGVGYAEKLLAKVPPMLERCYAVRDVLDVQLGRWQRWADEGKARWLAFAMADDERMVEGTARAPFDTTQHMPTARARVAQRRGARG